MKIGIDIDEVLCETVRSFLKVVEVKKGIKKNFEDIFSYNLHEVFGISKGEILDLFEGFFKESFNSLKLIEGAREGVRFLEKNHELFFITNRCNSIKEETLEFLEKFVPDPKTHFSGEVYDGQGESKAEICKNLGIGVIVEDNGVNSIDYAKKGVKVLLLDKPWNQGCEHENIFRCNDWRKILEKIAEMECEK